MLFVFHTFSYNILQHYVLSCLWHNFGASASVRVAAPSNL